MKIFEVETIYTIDDIKRDCVPFLKQQLIGPEDISPHRRGNILYRGMTYNNMYDPPDTPEYNIVKVSTTRTATINPNAAELNQLMKQDGFIATRENTFLTTSMNHAMDFGTVYRIYPIGQFSLTWFDFDGLCKAMIENEIDINKNPDTDPSFFMRAGDLGGGTWQFIAMEILKKHIEKYGNDEFSKMSIAKVFWTLFGKFFKHGMNVQDVIGSGSEIMLSAVEGYYAVRNANVKQIISL